MEKHARERGDAEVVALVAWLLPSAERMRDRQARDLDHLLALRGVVA